MFRPVLYVVIGGALAAGSIMTWQNWDVIKKHFEAPTAPTPSRTVRKAPTAGELGRFWWELARRMRREFVRQLPGKLAEGQALYHSKLEAENRARAFAAEQVQVHKMLRPFKTVVPLVDAMYRKPEERTVEHLTQVLQECETMKIPDTPEAHVLRDSANASCDRWMKSLRLSEQYDKFFNETVNLRSSPALGESVKASSMQLLKETVDMAQAGNVDASRFLNTYQAWVAKYGEPQD